MILGAGDTDSGIKSTHHRKETFNYSHEREYLNNALLTLITLNVCTTSWIPITPSMVEHWCDTCEKLHCTTRSHNFTFKFLLNQMQIMLESCTIHKIAIISTNVVGFNIFDSMCIEQDWFYYTGNDTDSGQALNQMIQILEWDDTDSGQYLG